MVMNFRKQKDLMGKGGEGGKWSTTINEIKFDDACRTNWLKSTKTNKWTFLMEMVMVCVWNEHMVLMYLEGE